MKSNKLLGLIVASATATLVPACATTGHATIVAYEEPPPPLREEVVVYRPGFVWVHGNWARDYEGRWRWNGGYYVDERPGYVYMPGRWERRGRNYAWVGGTWRASGGVVIRRHHY